MGLLLDALLVSFAYQVLIHNCAMGNILDLHCMYMLQYIVIFDMYDGLLGITAVTQPFIHVHIYRYYTLM